jgi:UDP-GlcNAc:undecaprenyl-phosphate/decaprenyl-phosphate GlcNAc-1-phosphate transferase
MALLLGLGLGALLVPAAVWAGEPLGVVDRPGPLAIHTRPVSLLGGIAVTVAALGAAAIAGDAPPAAAIAGIAVALLVGSLDDAGHLPVWLRLLGQAGAGGLLVLAGLRLTPFGSLDGVALVVLVVLLTNAVNVLDGQDGLAGGLAAIAAAGLVGVGGWASGEPAVTLGLALIGALVAFLAWNLPRARVFLGNGGSYAVGALLAVLVAAISGEAWPGLLAATLCLGVFAFELLYTVFRRLRAGRPVTAGDRDHSYDALAARLGSRPRSTLTFWAVGAAAAALGLLADAVA